MSLSRNKKHNFTVTERFGDENIEDIFKKQIVRFVNDQKGFNYLTLQEKESKNKNTETDDS